ncbi:hypothetical protein CEUSTIGMA_g5752.t1 [Chlamydomonas eustigma]|uniref:Uncharacterized protein n=1 Tax=Chlamydomonas eustigma TaxID=1157962 RepID=A0A250X6B2_9CHLO|nr:hypothetical protein CEUSTIGMA_g5752.t1 [Chlamydomonas eustigma]|eukprot:GAX78310.1 hypothetical protein CEUSTIGMA_g5752.t1 [Chlamydomonas eustigma]
MIQSLSSSVIRRCGGYHRLRHEYARTSRRTCCATALNRRDIGSSIATSILVTSLGPCLSASGNLEITLRPPSTADPILVLPSSSMISDNAADSSVTSCSAAADSANGRSMRRKMSGRLGADFNAAVLSTLLTMKVTDEKSFQSEVFKLRDREYKYYYENNKDRLEPIPDLSDMAGGLSNPSYFNFVSYILWKVAARKLPSTELRTQFGLEYGRQLLKLVWDNAADQIQLQLAETPRSRSRDATSDLGSTASSMRQPASSGIKQDGRQILPASRLISVVQQLLERLQSQGYMCGYQIVWGEVPGTWPEDWMKSQPRVVVAEQLMDGNASELDEAGNGAGSASKRVGSMMTMQIKLHMPADIEGGVALRAEEDGFWPRAVSSMLFTIFELTGYGSSQVDEYFYQDYWSGPAKMSDKLLLMLGDPFEQVDIPWVPTTLVQDWVIMK